MADTAFRTQSPVEVKSDTPSGKDSPETGDKSGIEVPFLDYETEHGRPHSADYFSLGDTWNDPQGGFPKEVETIESYIQELIKSGEIANSTSAVKLKLKNMEKVIKMSEEERATVKIPTLAAYIRFIRDTSHLKQKVGGAYQ